LPIWGRRKERKKKTGAQIQVLTKTLDTNLIKKKKKPLLIKKNCFIHITIYMLILFTSFGLVVTVT
jgi:hypothetical protein